MSVSAVRDNRLEVTDGHVNPRFEEKFVFNLSEGLKEIHVAVWNRSTFTRDDLIGVGNIVLYKALSEGFDDSAARKAESNSISSSVRSTTSFTSSSYQYPACTPPVAPVCHLTTYSFPAQSPYPSSYTPQPAASYPPPSHCPPPSKHSAHPKPSKSKKPNYLQMFFHQPRLSLHLHTTSLQVLLLSGWLLIIMDVVPLLVRMKIGKCLSWRK